MIGFNIGIGVNVIYSQPVCKSRGEIPPEENVYQALMTEDGGVFYLEDGNGYIQLESSRLSCFATGRWRMDGSWYDDDVWKNEPGYISCFDTGKWRMDGIYSMSDRWRNAPVSVAV